MGGGNFFVPSMHIFLVAKEMDQAYKTSSSKFVVVVVVVVVAVVVVVVVAVVGV